MTQESPQPVYQVKQESYEGPIDKLLDLARDHQIDIFKVSLATIAEEFLAYVHTLNEVNLDEVGDFLVIASNLLVMKSRSLLPTETIEEDLEPIDEEALLIKRIKDYEKFREVADLLRKAEEERRKFYLRESPPPSVSPRDVVEFYEVNVIDLATAFKRVLAEIGATERKVIQGEEYTIDEKMAEIQLLLAENQEFCLTLYLQSLRSRVELIVTFLALLELIRLSKATARQTAQYGDIWIFRVESLHQSPEGETELAVSDDGQGFLGNQEETILSEAGTGQAEESIQTRTDIESPPTVIEGQE